MNNKTKVVIVIKILECSSKGDKRYSAFYAKVKLFDKYDSIENHYQLSKRVGDFAPKSWREVKGKKPTHLHINGQDYDIKYTQAFYELMWVKYLDEHPNLVEYASQFDDFNDIFKSKNAVVCQADTIKEYIKNGREHLMEKHRGFIEILSESR